MKKGFTLIELMVVVIIMGVLAAIGVPKIFGLGAKAKASELQPAAGTYVHLQEAHIVGNTTIGDWKQIGYAAPVNGNSKNFCYSQGDLKTSIDIASNGEGIIGWGATNKAILNECAANNWWSITINGTDKSSITFKQNVSETNCQTLLANWNVGTTLTGDCESTDVASRDPSGPSDTKTPDTNTPTTPPDKSVNLDEYYSYANGEYQKCGASNDSWLNGKKNGSDCKPLRDLLYDNGDLVLTDKGNNNHYDYKDENTRCLVTKNCSDEDYTKALDAKRAEEEAKKAAEEEAKRKAEEEANGNTNQSGDNSQSEEKEDDISGDGSDETPKICTDKSHKSCPCEKIGSNGKCS